MSAALRELRRHAVVYLYPSRKSITRATDRGSAPTMNRRPWKGSTLALLRLLRSLPAGVRTVMTADHGMIYVMRRRSISPPPRAYALYASSLEVRAVHVHAVPGPCPTRWRRWRDVLGEALDHLRRRSAPLIGEGDDCIILPRARTRPCGSRRLAYAERVCDRDAGCSRLAHLHGNAHPGRGLARIADMRQAARPPLSDRLP